MARGSDLADFGATSSVSCDTLASMGPRSIMLLVFVAACRCGSEGAEEPVMTSPELPSDPALGGDPALPGVRRVDAALTERLRAAVAAKGPDYVPRTEHLRDDGSPRYVNRLVLERSPYLLQHAHNPVNWFPWGEEAFERARAEGKPVLLSVGYSTCHWCHVMEHESFEDEEVARTINAHFIPIKVDREERPDIDAVYMSAVYALTGRGGWPMTVVMTPDGDPFFAGTYFPPRDGVRGARRGLLSILAELVERYREQPAEVVAQAQALSQRLQAASAPRPPADLPGPETIVATVRSLARGFDARFGGFGGAPKFPQPSRLALLLRYHRRTGDASALAMVLRTLDAMARGGIHDHVGGGFHRYATDARWLIPHFEKMLYDNAQLARLYLEAMQASGAERFGQVARETLDYVAREMTGPHGGFYSATDADSRTPSGELEEGYYFTWTPAELTEALGPELATEVIATCGVTESGNFEGRNILHLPRPLEDIARFRGVDVAELRRNLDEARRRLREARARRPPPLRDEKVLTAWNGLMIGAFARGAAVLDEPAYAERAEAAARFVLSTLRDEEGRLMRSYLGEPRQRAFLADYAFLIAGLLDLHEATGQARWLQEALRLQREQEELFSGEGAGAYWSTARDAERLLTREQPSDDGALPSGNAVSIDNLLRLAELTADGAWRRRAEECLRAFGAELRRRGPGMTAMLAALDRYHDQSRAIVLAHRDRVAARRLQRVVEERFLPNRVLAIVSDESVDRLAASFGLLAGKHVQGEGAATAYVCERGRCEAPTSEPATLRAQLAPVRPLVEPPPPPLRPDL